MCDCSCKGQQLFLALYVTENTEDRDFVSNITGLVEFYYTWLYKNLNSIPHINQTFKNLVLTRYAEVWFINLFCLSLYFFIFFTSEI